MVRDEVRFGVKLTRKDDGVLKEVAENVEGRTKANFHRCLCRRVSQLWQDPNGKKQLLELGLIRRGVE